MRIISTKKRRKDKKGREILLGNWIIADKTCRICKGTRKMQHSGFTVDCIHCDKDGNAKVGCGDCGEVLPGCECVRKDPWMLGWKAEVKRIEAAMSPEEVHADT